jgi:hypothetical protein
LYVSQDYGGKQPRLVRKRRVIRTKQELSFVSMITQSTGFLSTETALSPHFYWKTL